MPHRSSGLPLPLPVRPRHVRHLHQCSGTVGLHGVPASLLVLGRQRRRVRTVLPRLLLPCRLLQRLSRAVPGGILQFIHKCVGGGALQRLRARQLLSCWQQQPNAVPCWQLRQHDSHRLFCDLSPVSRWQQVSTGQRYPDPLRHRLPQCCGRNYMHDLHGRPLLPAQHHDNCRSISLRLSCWHAVLSWHGQ